MLTILFLVVSEDLRNKKMMDANLQTNRRQWSRTADEICSEMEGGMDREGLVVRGGQRDSMNYMESDVTM